MNHLNLIQSKLLEYGLDAMIVKSEPGEFYAVGLRGEGLALVTREGNFYSTDSRYIELVEKTVTDCEIAMIGNGRSHIALAAGKCRELGLARVGYEENYLTVADFEELRRSFPAGTEFVPAGALLNTLRQSKDEEELSRMRKAQEITDRTFTEIQKYIRPGVTEREIAARLTYLQMSFGAEKNSFDPIVASGANGSMPHAIPSEKQVREGEFLTMDFGCIYQGYCSDMTRTVAVGEPTEEMRRVYETVRQGQLTGIAMAKAGVIGADVHNTVVKLLDDAGYVGRMGHGLGHSLGIEIHENPGFRPLNHEPMPLHAAVSVEPGIYLPGKFGVRIEDVVVLKEDGCEVLTHSPKNLIVIH